jgi:hypothetical protein
VAQRGQQSVADEDVVSRRAGAHRNSSHSAPAALGPAGATWLDNRPTNFM